MFDPSSEEVPFKVMLFEEKVSCGIAASEATQGTVFTSGSAAKTEIANTGIRRERNMTFPWFDSLAS